MWEDDAPDDSQWDDISGGTGVPPSLILGSSSWLQTAFSAPSSLANPFSRPHYEVLGASGPLPPLSPSPPHSPRASQPLLDPRRAVSPSPPRKFLAYGSSDQDDGPLLFDDQTIDPDMDLVSFDPDDPELLRDIHDEKLTRIRRLTHHNNSTHNMNNNNNNSNNNSNNNNNNSNNNNNNIIASSSSSIQQHRSPSSSSATLPSSPSSEDDPSSSAPSPREITLPGVLIVIVLSAVLGGANAYLGLFAGITISVSIPSALIALMLLRPFDPLVGPLQINVIQTGASAGSSLAAGVIYTLPALLFLEHWARFEYLETSLIAAVGGCLGVLFSIPLRRSLVVESPELVFPEGTAIANVLKVIATQNADSRANRRAMLILSLGLAIAAFVKLCDTGLQLWSPYALGAWFLSSSSVFGLGLSLSPALLSVGYIVGLRAGGLMVVGALLNWWLAIPVASSLHTSPWPQHASAKQVADFVWATQTRYMGVGAMLVGGIGTVAFLARPLYRGVLSGVQAWRKIRSHGASAIPRTERDIPLLYVAVAALLSPIALLFLFYWFVADWGVAAFAAVFLLLTGFLFSAVGGFMAGLVGSSNNPISGITLCVVIFSSLVLLAFLGPSSAQGPAAAILMGAVIACAAALAGDNMQDLRTGYLLGATPWKQQLMQMVGVVAAAAVLAPVVRLLITAYGIGPPTPAQPNALPAPQATLMWKVAEGVFTLDLPWVFIGVGAGFALLLLLLDLALLLRHASFRVPVLAVALGLYLPFELSASIFVGSVVSGLSVWTLQYFESSKLMRAQYRQYGVFLCAGMITGEALTGIILAVVIVIAGDPNVLAFAGPQAGYATGLLLYLCIAILLYFVVVWSPIKTPIHEYFDLETE